MHKYSIGQAVDFESAFQHNAARGEYKITRSVPVERDNSVLYRIKNPAEAFERTAEEYQLDARARVIFSLSSRARRVGLKSGRL